MTSKETRDLKPGDILAFTKAEVISTPVSLMKTPKGRLDFVVKTKSGNFIQKSWNRHTLINIL